MDSLLAQTYPHAAFVFADDCSGDGTPELIASIAANDKRVVLERNTRRLGLVKNWCRVFNISRQLYPDAPYFAWGSDHDWWDQRWLQTLVAELDDHPEAVVVYPRFTRIDARGLVIKEACAGGATHGLSRWHRFAAVARRKIGAGKIVYGLHRAEMLQRAGVYSLVHQPDIYNMIELSLYGEIRLVPETLWHVREDRRRKPRQSLPQPLMRDRTTVAEQRGWLDRVARRFSAAAPTRQHRNLFPERIPLYSRLPAWLQHFSLFFLRLVVLGRGAPYIGRLEATGYAGWFFLTRLFGENDPKKVRTRRRQRAELERSGK